MNPVVRVSILTVPEGHIDEALDAMRKAEAELMGIQRLKGCARFSLELIAPGRSQPMSVSGIL